MESIRSRLKSYQRNSLYFFPYSIFICFLLSSIYSIYLSSIYFSESRARITGKSKFRRPITLEFRNNLCGCVLYNNSNKLNKYSKVNCTLNRIYFETFRAYTRENTNKIKRA